MNHFISSFVEKVVFCIVNESVAGDPKLFILRFMSEFEVRDERYKFSKMDLEVVIKYHEPVN